MQVSFNSHSNKLIRAFTACVSVVMVAACAMTYEAPTAIAPRVSQPVNAAQKTIMDTAEQVLVGDGYQITYANDAAGTISTAPRDLHVTPEQANCGTTMGIDYLKDKRTETTVAFGVLAENNRVSVKATIQGNYRPGDPTQDITLTCVSRGVLESQLMNQITAALAK